MLDAAKRSGAGHSNQRKIPWLKNLKCTSDNPNDDTSQRSFYTPRIYITSGTFDVAAIFLSPEMEMNTWVRCIDSWCQ